MIVAYYSLISIFPSCKAALWNIQLTKKLEMDKGRSCTYNHCYCYFAWYNNDMHWCAQSCCFTVLRWEVVVFLTSKAFDTVDHTILSYCLEVMACFLLRWYQPQCLRAKWNGFTSDAFSVSWGVRQGGVLSPIRFTLYIDSLLKKLSQSSGGCYWGNIFVGALAYILMTSSS